MKTKKKLYNSQIRDKKLGTKSFRGWGHPCRQFTIHTVSNNYLYRENMSYIYPAESQSLIGIAMQLHRELGCGFKEKVYQDAFEVLLKENDIPYEREKHITLTFHGVVLEHDFYYDFFCYGKIGVELKAMGNITGEHESQIINYIHVGNHRLGILFNFGSTSLQYKCYPNRENYNPTNK